MSRYYQYEKVDQEDIDRNKGVDYPIGLGIA